jgi:hypothetical protein
MALGSLKLQFSSTKWRAAMQRKEPAASTRFLGVQFHDLCSRSAAVRVDGQPTHCLTTSQIARPEAVIGTSLHRFIVQMIAWRHPAVRVEAVGCNAAVRSRSKVVRELTRVASANRSQA